MTEFEKTLAETIDYFGGKMKSDDLIIHLDLSSGAMQWMMRGALERMRQDGLVSRYAVGKELRVGWSLTEKGLVAMLGEARNPKPRSDFDSAPIRRQRAAEEMWAYQTDGKSGAPVLSESWSASIPLR